VCELKTLPKSGSWIAIICLLSTLSLFTSGAQAMPGQTEVPTVSWWSQVFDFRNYGRQDEIEEESDKILRAIAPANDATIYKKAGKVRKFIANNSVNVIDNEMYSYWADVPLQLQMLRAHNRNPDKPLPHMECAMRTVVMYTLLKRMGITSRIMIIHPSAQGEISHTYLEVYDPETKSWSIQDPLLNIFWKFRNSDKRASTEDLLKYPIKETFVPCHAKTGCNYTPAVESMLGYYAMAQIVDLGSAYNPVMINPDRFDEKLLKDMFAGTRRFCDILVKGCTNEVIKIKSAPPPEAAGH
jgi:hypothetical protein